MEDSGGSGSSGNRETNWQMLTSGLQVGSDCRKLCPWISVLPQSGTRCRGADHLAGWQLPQWHRNTVLQARKDVQTVRACVVLHSLAQLGNVAPDANVDHGPLPASVCSVFPNYTSWTVTLTHRELYSTLPITLITTYSQELHPNAVRVQQQY